MQRSDSKHNKWARQVKDRAGRVCQFCGTSARLEAHHIIPVCVAPDLETEVSNGVCLCHHHHLAAHGGSYNGYIPLSSRFGVATVADE